MQTVDQALSYQQAENNNLSALVDYSCIFSVP